MKNLAGPRTLLEAVRYFTDKDRALAFMVEAFWPDGVVCPACGSKKVTFLKSRGLWNCQTKHPKRQFSIKVGTIMEDSPIGLDKWLPAMWLLANCKNGISSYELARALKVTQRTAWFMLGRIRLAMQESGGKLGGPGSTVQVDETYIGGKARSMNQKRRGRAMQGRGSAYATPRPIVLGMLEKGGRVRLKHVGDAKRRTLLSEVVKQVQKGSEIHTDQLNVYDGLVSPDYAHKVVNHTETYVDGAVHTQGIENFWSLLKRAIRGTYVSVEPFHLFRYLDEQAFRFNYRKDDDQGRFVETVRNVLGRRLTYRQLIGADQPVTT
jgi:transposase-like protein